ncbi:MAG TPA: hypothetical protein VJS69_05085, partial [Candidatus Krumholzibacteria bacterium]|nr:hypothetical protein [Candidatus Krumholzibacteria bacterium]
MRLRHFALALTALSLSATGARANPAHLWSQRWVHPDNQSFERVVVDASGNILVCGDFTSSLNLGSVYPSAGFQDVFVAKFSPAGSLVWMRTLGDVRPDRAMDLAVDLTGNVIFAGHLSSTMNDADAVVVKYAPDGTQRWFKRFGAGDLHFQSAECVSVNLSKEIIIAGEFDGPFSLGGPTLQPTGGITFFMAKLDQNGNHLWSKRFTTSTPYSYNLHGLETGADGETTFCGTLIDSLNLGNGVLKTAGQADMFLARFDAGGNVLWSRSYGDSLAQEPTDIAVDAAGQIALAGFTNGAVCLGGDTLRAATDFDPFVAVLNSSGGHVWSRIFTGSSNQYPASLAWAGNQ